MADNIVKVPRLAGIYDLLEPERPHLLPLWPRPRSSAPQFSFTSDVDEETSLACLPDMALTPRRPGRRGWTSFDIIDADRRVRPSASVLAHEARGLS